MTISNEAVDAAARAIFEYMEDRQWDTADPMETEFFRSAARMSIRAGESLRKATK